MAATEVSGPSMQFTKIKEPDVPPAQVPEQGAQEGTAHRAEGPPSAAELQAEGSCRPLQAKLLEGELALVPAPSEKHILTLQTVHVASEDVEMRELGWLSAQPAEEVQVVVQADGGLPSLLWLRGEPQQSAQQCLAISVQEELFPLPGVEVMQFHLLEESASASAAGQERQVAARGGPSTGLTKVQLFVIN